jgi:glycosyltransferase involved in cell wall biosynthesis
MAQGNGSAGGRVALVHDFLVDVRGAERVFLALCDTFPATDVFTAVYNERGTEGRFAHRRVHTSFLQALRPSSRTFRALLPSYPSAMESLNLRGYDLVLSSSSAWAHGVIPDESAVHVCYCHNPFRYAWNAREETLERRGPLARAALGLVFQRWRQWDWIAAQRVDAYVANCETTRGRVGRYFGREATVLHPPVETARFAPGQVGDAYVVLSELMPHKRIDVAVRAFNELRLPLVVIGNGPDDRRLRPLAGPTVTLIGRVSDAEAAARLAAARALVVTGMFYAEPHPAALAGAVRRFDPMAIDPCCVENAARFDVAHFRHRLRAVVDRALAGERPAGPPRPRPPRRPAGPAWQA